MLALYRKRPASRRVSPFATRTSSGPPTRKVLTCFTGTNVLACWYKYSHLRSDSRVPLMHFESMQDVQLFAVGAAAGTRGRSGDATATGGRSGSNSGGRGETYGHAGAPRMLLVGSCSSGVSICTFFVPVSKYFCTSKASEHLVCQARACSADTYRFFISMSCSNSNS